MKNRSPVFGSFLLLFLRFCRSPWLTDFIETQSEKMITHNYFEAALFSQRLDSDKMEGNNNKSMDSDEEEVAVVQTAGKEGVGGKNWPHMKFLVPATKMSWSRSCMPTMVTTPKATTGISCMITALEVEVQSPGRGLLAGHLPKLPTSSKFKQKVTDIWAYLKKESTEDFVKVDINLVQVAL
jgi:hypothetical protein